MVTGPLGALVLVALRWSVQRGPTPKLRLFLGTTILTVLLGPVLFGIGSAVTAGEGQDAAAAGLVMTIFGALFGFYLTIPTGVLLGAIHVALHALIEGRARPPRDGRAA